MSCGLIEELKELPEQTYTTNIERRVVHNAAGAATQPLFSLILSRAIDVYVYLSANFRRCKPPGNRLTSGV